MFVDKAKILIQSGKGGDGAVTFRREPFVPEGGPDGGDGGKGGDVIFMADANLRTLLDFRYKRKYKARNGENGMKKNRFGKKGEDLIIKVPPGTMIIHAESGKLMGDLVNKGDRLIAAKGGKGGKGNVHFKNSVRQAPNFAEAGGSSQELEIVLELKLIADVGLVGFPNVGKSSLLQVSTKANPKIANYHFTTIEPNLGVVEVSNTSFVMADIAGIIQGAHLGAGMGFKFLKHIERTKILIHVVDVSGCEGRDPVDDFYNINKELSEYSPLLGEKPQIVAANKIDLLEDEETDEKLKKLEEAVKASDLQFFKISAPINRGVLNLMEAAAALLAKTESEKPCEEKEIFDFDREEKDPNYRTVYAGKENDYFVLEGKQLLKIFRSTNFEDIGSLRYLYKYIEKSGAIEELKKKGLKEGDTIKIEDFEFEYMDEF